MGLTVRRSGRPGGFHATACAAGRRRDRAHDARPGQGAQTVTSTKELYATGQDRTR
ncbi:hypothetical protein PT2222_10126 [Paraburkholderia tropica]